MAGIKDQENIDELRKRLYARSHASDKIERHELTRPPVEVSRGWGTSVAASPETSNLDTTLSATAPAIPDAVLNAQAATQNSTPMTANPTEFLPPLQKKKKPRYRLFILIISLFLFIIAAGVSSFYLFMGANQISAKNISITMDVPPSLAGGEVLPIQISITNQNSVAISSAVLIINYPPGTRSAEEGGRELYEERLPIEIIEAGQAINIPIKAVLYGEANAVMEIKASVEYRVEGSNGTFFKEAEPQQVTISSSPLVVRILGESTVSSGQEVEYIVEVQSNASGLQKNILVSGGLPSTFNFLKSNPEAVYGNNSWLIPELEPGTKKEIRIVGSVQGAADEQSEIRMQVGNPQINNQFMMGSVLSQASFMYTIEKPFTNVSIDINGDTDGDVSVADNTQAMVGVSITNTLDVDVYDMRVVISLDGNLIHDDLVSVKNANDYYSVTRELTYSPQTLSTLARVRAADTRNFYFSVSPDEKQLAAAFGVTVAVYGKRSTDQSAPEVLIGTSKAAVKYSSSPTLGSQVGYNDGVFKDTGPIPPVSGEKTTYTVTMRATASSNDLAGTVVTATIPSQVTWLSEVDGDGKIEFNPTAKQLRWEAGDIPHGQSKTVSFQVAFVPTRSQAGRSAVIVGSQELRATDRFTSTTLRVTQKELINELSTEFGFVSGNGEVQAD